MKSILFLCITISLALISCKKQETTPENKPVEKKPPVVVEPEEKPDTVKRKYIEKIVIVKIPDVRWDMKDSDFSGGEEADLFLYFYPMNRPGGAYRLGDNVPNSSFPLTVGFRERNVALTNESWVFDFYDDDSYAGQFNARETQIGRWFLNPGKLENPIVLTDDSLGVEVEVHYTIRTLK